LDKAKRKVRHRGETEASQLGWHPTETPSSTAIPIHNIIKKGEKYVQVGGLGRNPQQKKKELTRKAINRNVKGNGS